MKPLALILALLFALPAMGQTPVIQKAHCSSATTCTYATRVTAGDLLIVTVRASFQVTFTDPSGATWTPLDVNGWYGVHDTLWYATATAGNPVVTFASPIADISMLEYPPAVLASRSAAVQNCCNATVSLGPITTTANGFFVLLINPSSPDTFTVPGFTQQDNSGEVIVMDEKAPAGTYSAVVPQGHYESWGAQLFAFTLTAPPPPPVFDTITIATQLYLCTACPGGALSADDVPFTGTLVVTQGNITDSFGFNSNGTIAAKANILVSVDPADFVFTLRDSGGNALPGPGIEYKIPQSVLAGTTALGTLSIPPFRIQSAATGLVFRGFLTP